ncbi:MAG: hypothetical protein LBT74_08685 [Acidobacteriota bacterium]|jgi:diacylglycerol kinase family enzyme|nr:hypothetical protein [Acidobacteriota bacterium]
MRIAIIANPAAGRGRPFKKLQGRVRTWRHPQWEVELLPTQAPGHAGALARELLSRPPDVLAVCGGDGSVNEVVSALPPQPPFPLAVLSGGTANVLARELGMPLHPVRALDVALEAAFAGKVRRMDVGVADLGVPPDAPVDGGVGARVARKFTFVAGVGFDAWAVHEASLALKSKVGIAAYALAALRALRHYPFPEFTVVADGGSHPAVTCLVCNSRRYGGGFSFCPGADMADGLLDVLVIGGVGRAGGVDRAKLASFLLSAWVCPGRAPSWTRRLRTRELRIEGPSSVLVETDGELAGALPAKFSLLEKALPLIAA